MQTIHFTLNKVDNGWVVGVHKMGKKVAFDGTMIAKDISELAECLSKLEVDLKTFLEEEK